MRMCGTDMHKEVDKLEATYSQLDFQSGVQNNICKASRGSRPYDRTIVNTSWVTFVGCKWSPENDLWSLNG